jgi:hypothetical protein
MSMRKLLAVSLLLLPGVVFAQSPFDGTWKTNMSASKLTQKPFVYSLNHGTYVCETCVPKVDVKADGTDQAVTGQAYDTVAVTVIDANTMHLTTKKAGKMVTDSVRNVSADGKTMTISSTNYPASGTARPFNTTAKLDRIAAGSAGSNATSGSWRVQSVDESNAAVTTTWKGSGDGLSMTAGTGETWTAKFDGKEYPVTGTYLKETVALKKLGDHAIEVTTKRDGKLYSVEKMTVAPDGTKMTTVVSNKQTGRVSTFVDEKQ